MPESIPQKVAFRTGLQLLGVLGLILITILVRDILLLGFIAIVIAVLLSFPVNFLSRRMPRGVAVTLTLLFLITSLTGVGFFAVPAISEQVQSITQQLPEAIGRIQRWYIRVKKSEPVAKVPQGGKIADNVGKNVGGLVETGVKGIIPVITGFAGGVSSVVFVFVLSIFFIAHPDNYRKGMKKLIPQAHEKVFDEALSRLHQVLRSWVGGILIAMTLMGTFTAIGLALAGIDNWPLLAVLTFFGTFVPYLGAIASAVPGLLIALSQSTQHFLLACGVYLGVHILEGYIVEPLIMRRAVEIKPAVLLLGEGVLVMLFGIMGVVVTAPLLACIQVIVQYLYVEKELGKGRTEMENEKRTKQQTIDREYIEQETPEEIAEIARQKNIPDKADREPTLAPEKKGNVPSKKAG